MELLTTITLFGSIFWGITALVLFIAACFWADYEENGWLATFFLIVLGCLFYFFGKDTWTAFVSWFSWTYVALYFAIGLVHAFIRIFFWGRNEMMKVNEYRKKDTSLEYEIDKRELKGHVFRWWFLWPASLIMWIIRDIVKDVYNFVYDKFSRMFEYVMNLGVKSVKEVPKKERKK